MSQQPTSQPVPSSPGCQVTHRHTPHTEDAGAHHQAGALHLPFTNPTTPTSHSSGQVGTCVLSHSLLQTPSAGALITLLANWFPPPIPIPCHATASLVLQQCSRAPRALTGGDVEVDGLAVHLALLRVLHSCQGQVVALPRQQVPHRVGHQLPVGHVAALDALGSGDVDDVPLHGANGGLLPRHGHRGGGDMGGREVLWGERPCSRQGMGRKAVRAGVPEWPLPSLLMSPYKCGTAPACLALPRPALSLLQPWDAQ